MVLFILMMSFVQGMAAGSPSPRKKKVARIVVDTVAQQRVATDVVQPRKMSNSAFPVQVSVTGRALRIVSEHNQILPIYTESGTFYMVMKLTKGTNWLNGLPRGRYFVNNRPITIGL